MKKKKRLIHVASGMIIEMDETDIVYRAWAGSNAMNKSCFVELE